jgi:hypothetical protein
VITPEWTDEELIDYCEYHSRTEVALFHRDHIERICKLAGREVPDIPVWISVDRWTMAPIVKAARERCSKRA